MTLRDHQIDSVDYCRSVFVEVITPVALFHAPRQDHTHLTGNVAKGRDWVRMDDCICKE